MNSYQSLALRYDALTADVDHEAWADYLEKHFARAPIPIHTVLDLACGTGAMTCVLARRGYELIGVDLSEEMLAVAAEKARALTGVIPPLFLQQPMEELDLYGTIDACICCLDSVNYVTRPRSLLRAFQRVHLFLMPGGLFIFDVNTPEKLEGLDGGMFIDETDDTYCVWRADYARRSRICTYGFDLFFRQDDGLWRLHTGGAHRAAPGGRLHPHPAIRRPEAAAPQARRRPNFFHCPKGPMNTLWMKLYA